MVERPGRDGIATFYAADEALFPGALVSLGDGIARHIHVRRLGPGHEILLVDGVGRRATATILRASREGAQVQVRMVQETEPLPEVHLLVPVADRDRMLWMAEKCTELGASSWRPVMWRRSHHVTPRGEGPTFARRVRARMAAALEQSSGAYLPTLFPEAKPERAVAASPPGTRLFLQLGGVPLATTAFRAPVTIAIGPEGGYVDEEIVELEGAGFVRASLGGTILRFETAAVAALAIVRSYLHAKG